MQNIPPESDNDVTLKCFVLDGKRTPGEVKHTLPYQSSGVFLTRNNVLIASHPSYSPDLTPRDFFFVPEIKNETEVEKISYCGIN